MQKTTLSLLFIALLLVTMPAIALAGETATSPTLDSGFFLLASALGWLLPLGILLLAVGASPESEAKQVVTWGLAAIPISILAYAFLGFGFQFGGLGLVSDLPGAEGLRREWSPLDLAWGPEWGVIGLDAFSLIWGGLPQGLFVLFLHQAPLLAAAVAIATTALARRLRFSHIFILAVFSGAIFYPLFGNWIWGGGWLSRLGATVSLGHGTVDFSGGATVFALGAGLALAGILVLGGRLPEVRGPAAPPPIHFPLLATVGALFIIVSGMALALGNPLLADESFFPEVAVNLLLAVLGGWLLSALYTWFATGSPELLMALRGAVAGLVGGLAIGPFLPPWVALLLGSIAGLLLPITVYFVENKLRWEDPTASISTYFLPGLLGFIFSGLFADGKSGGGWNGVGQGEYLGVPGQGVSGLWVAPGYQSTPGQLYAQLLGVLALLLIILLAAILLRAIKGPDSDRKAITPQPATPSPRRRGKFPA